MTGTLSGSQSDAARDWQDLACAEQFEWCLLDDVNGSTSDYQSGVGSTDSMPYADEVLALLPSLDVRLIETKVPLANAKKLQQILPNLIEEYVLSGAQAIAVQAFPPVPGRPALQRTIALYDRAWFSWIVKQLEGMISQRVRLIPDCLLLALPRAMESQDGQVLVDESSPALISSIAPAIAYQHVEENIIFTRRTGDQLGLAWVERVAEQNTPPTLPQALQGLTIEAFSWGWVAQSARQFLQENKSSRSANFSLNLLPKTFRRQLGKSGIAGLSTLLKRSRRGVDVSDHAGATWADPSLWRQPTQWAKYLVATIVIGYVLHLGWLVMDNWRWGNQLEVLAAQSLTPSSIAKLNQDSAAGTATQSKTSSNAVLTAFVKQVTQDQRSRGLVVDADFAPMAAKLQQLKLAFGPDVLQKLDYDGYGIDFEFKPASVKQTSEQVVQKARALGLMVKPLGPNRYRLEPYSGLGASSMAAGGGS